MKKRHTLILSFVIPAVIFCVMLAVRHIVPLGDNTFLYDDMKRQYIEFYSYYKTILRGRNDFLYSFSAGLGGEMLGFSAYYLTSPFLIPLAFIPEGMLPTAITVMMGIKVSLCGLSACFCMFDVREEMNEQEQNPAILAVFSTAYAFCQFIMLNMTNIMWLDSLMCFPILLMLVRRMLKKRDGSSIFYILCLSISLFCSYYISYMILIFLFIYVLMFAGSKKEIAGFIASSASGAALAAFLLLPTFFSLLTSWKNSFSYGVANPRPNISPVAVISKFFSMSYDNSQIFEGNPQLYCGLPMLIGLILFFLNKDIEQGVRIRYLAIFIILIASFCIEKINCFWHAFTEPEGYLYRFSFMVSYLTIECALRCYLKRKGIKARNIAAAAVIAGALLVMSVLGRFSYLGTQKAVVNAGLILIIAAILFSWSKADKKTVKSAALGMLCAVQILGLARNVIYVYDTTSLGQMKNSEYKAALARIRPSVSEIRSNDDGFYRIEEERPFTRNDAFLFEYNGVNVYSSYTPVMQHVFISRLGYTDEPNYYTYAMGNTELADRLLGIKYFVTDVGAEALQSPLPVIFTSRRGIDSIASSAGEENVTADPFEFQQTIMNSYTGQDDRFFIDADVLEKREENDPVYKGRKKKAIKLRIQKDGRLYFYIKGIKSAEDIIITNDRNEETLHFGNASCMKVQSLGEFRKGDELTVACSNIVNVPDDSDFRFVTEDVQRVRSACDLISQEQAKVRETSASRLSIKTSGSDGTLVVAVPYDDNWHMTVDGRPAEQKKIFDIYMAIPLESKTQEHTIEMRYVPKGFCTGIVISAAAWLIFMIHLVRRRKMKS